MSWGGEGVEALCPGGYHDISHQQGCTIILWSSPLSMTYVSNLTINN